MSLYYVQNPRGEVVALQESGILGATFARNAGVGLGTYCKLIVARAEGVSTSLQALGQLIERAASADALKPRISVQAQAARYRRHLVAVRAFARTLKF